MKLRFLEQLPDFYRHYLPDSFLQTDPMDNFADCANCRMLKNDKPFHALTKCCTFHPYLANFLVGAILAEGGRGKAVVEDFIYRRIGATPIGLVAPESYQHRFLHKHPEDFGRRYDLRCPFYQDDSGTCGIWRNRGHECLAYHCVSRYGAAGQDYWQEIKTALYNFEYTLAHLLMLEKGFLQSEVEDCSTRIRISDPTDRSPEYGLSEWKRLWRHLAGREREYYLECYELAKSPSRELRHAIAEMNLRFSTAPAQSNS